MVVKRLISGNGKKYEENKTSHVCKAEANQIIVALKKRPFDEMNTNLTSKHLQAGVYNPAKPANQQNISWPSNRRETVPNVTKDGIKETLVEMRAEQKGIESKNTDQTSNRKQKPNIPFL